MLYATIKIFAVLSAILLDAKLAQLMRAEVGVALKLIRSIFESFETGVFVTCEVTAGAAVVIGGSVVVVGVVVVGGSVVGVGAVSELPPQEATKAKQIRRQVFFISKDHFIFYA